MVKEKKHGHMAQINDAICDFLLDSERSPVFFTVMGHLASLKVFTYSLRKCQMRPTCTMVQELMSADHY